MQNSRIQHSNEIQRVGCEQPGTFATEQLNLHASRPGKARTAILLWLLGVPIPLIILFFLLKSCMGGG